MIRCSGCEHGKSRVFERHGCGNSAYRGTFYQEGYICEYPGRGFRSGGHYIFYGKTAPRDCPLRKNKMR